ncbi:hypothetical protein GCM10027289_25790 [Tsukamurella serpentis]
MIDRPDTPHADALLEGIWEDEVTPDDLASRALSAAQASSYAFRVASEGSTATAQLGEVDVADFLESETGKWAQSFIGIVRVGESLVHVAHALGDLARSLQQVNLEQSQIVYQVEADIEAARRQSALAGDDPAERIAELIETARARAAEVAAKMPTPTRANAQDKTPAGLVSGFMAFGRVPGSTAAQLNGRVARTGHARKGYRGAEYKCGQRERDVADASRSVQDPVTRDVPGDAPETVSADAPDTVSEAAPDAATAAREVFADSAGDTPGGAGFLSLGRTPNLNGRNGTGSVEQLGRESDGPDDAVIPVVPQPVVAPAVPQDVHCGDGASALAEPQDPAQDRDELPAEPAPSSGPVPVVPRTQFLPIPTTPAELAAAGVQETEVDEVAEIPSAPAADDEPEPAAPEPPAVSVPVPAPPPDTASDAEAAPAPPVAPAPPLTPASRKGPATVRFADLLKASANGQGSAAAAPAAAPAPAPAAEQKAPSSPVLATGPVILGRTKPLSPSGRLSPEGHQVHDVVASILGSLVNGPNGPETGFHWAAGLLVGESETVMAVSTSDAGWLPPDAVIPAGVRVLWNMPTGYQWASIDDPVRQLLEYAALGDFRTAAVATTHPGQAYRSAVGATEFVGVSRPGAVLPGGRSRFEATVSAARSQHIRSLDRVQADRQARALIRDLEKQVIAEDHVIGLEAARLDARRFLESNGAVPPAVLEQLHSDARALSDVLRLDRTPAAPEDLSRPAPQAQRLRDRMLERAIVVATLAAADHDIESAVYAWTFARFLAGRSSTSSVQGA